VTRKLRSNSSNRRVRRAELRHRQHAGRGSPTEIRAFGPFDRRPRSSSMRNRSKYGDVETPSRSPVAVIFRPRSIRGRSKTPPRDSLAQLPESCKAPRKMSWRLAPIHAAVGIRRVVVSTIRRPVRGSRGQRGIARPRTAPCSGESHNAFVDAVRALRIRVYQPDPAKSGRTQPISWVAPARK